MARSIDQESSRPIMAPSVSSTRTSKRLSTFSAPSVTSEGTTHTTVTTDPRIAEIKQWSSGLERLESKRLQQQRYAPSQDMTDRMSKLALGAKVERALGRRMTDQDAVLRPRSKILSEKPPLNRAPHTTAV